MDWRALYLDSKGIFPLEHEPLDSYIGRGFRELLLFKIPSYNFGCFQSEDGYGLTHLERISSEMADSLKSLFDVSLEHLVYKVVEHYPPSKDGSKLEYLGKVKRYKMMDKFEVPLISILETAKEDTLLHETVHYLTIRSNEHFSEAFANFMQIFYPKILEGVNRSEEGAQVQINFRKKDLKRYLKKSELYGLKKAQKLEFSRIMQKLEYISSALGEINPSGGYNNRLMKWLMAYSLKRSHESMEKKKMRSNFSEFVTLVDRFSDWYGLELALPILCRSSQQDFFSYLELEDKRQFENYISKEQSLRWDIIKEKYF